VLRETVVRALKMASWTSESEDRFRTTCVCRWHTGKPQRLLVGQDLLIIKASRSHSLGLLWTSDRPDVEVSIRQHASFARDRHLFPRRVSNPQSQQASGRRLGP